MIIASSSSFSFVALFIISTAALIKTRGLKEQPIYVVVFRRPSSVHRSSEWGRKRNKTISFEWLYYSGSAAFNSLKSVGVD